MANQVPNNVPVVLPANDDNPAAPAVEADPVGPQPIQQLDQPVETFSGVKRRKTQDTRAFYSQHHLRPSTQWCDWKGLPTTIVGPRPSPQMVSSGNVLATPGEMIFRDPSSFVPGELHRHYDKWEEITPSGSADEILSFIADGVDVWSFVTPYKGTFAGQFYDAPYPPSLEFPNNPSCAQFKDFIDSTIHERVRTGSLLFWGFVGQITPPHLVMPITVEPTKPRMSRREVSQSLDSRPPLFA